MALTQADVDQLYRILASGANTITHSDGRTVRYNSPEEIRKVIQAAEAEIAGGTGGGRTTYASIERD